MGEAAQIKLPISNGLQLSSSFSSLRHVLRRKELLNDGMWRRKSVLELAQVVIKLQEGTRRGWRRP
jgi:hypothetical protein